MCQRLLVLAGWVNRQQQDVIDYLQEENRVLRAGLRGKRLRLSDDDRRRLAVKAQALGREALAQIASVATPVTLLRWYPFGQEIRPSLRSRGTTRIRVDTAVLHELLRLNKATCDRRPIQE